MKKKMLLLICMGILCLAGLTGCCLFHEWSDATCLEPKTCSKCGKTEGEVLEHQWISATCTEAKKCSACGKEQGEALGHQYTQTSILKEATCTEEGSVEYRCSTCGDTITKEIEKTSHTLGEWKTTQVADCKTEGVMKASCEICGEVKTKKTDKGDHTAGDWEVSKKATFDADGEQVKKCTVCGKVLKTKSYELSASEKKAAYKSKCQTYTYKQIARNPADYKYTYAKYKGEVVQVIEGDTSCQYRINITRGEYYWDDTIYVVYEPKEGESRILEDDIVTLYGINMETISYETVMGATVTIPLVYAEYMELD